jgi:hypothetical protein
MTPVASQGESTALPWRLISHLFLAAFGDVDMRKFSRTIMAALVATALAGGTYAFFGSPLVTVAQAHIKDHPALEKAYNALNDAEHYLKESKEDFKGDKEKAIHAINEAKQQIALAVKAVETKSVTDENFVPEPFEHKHPKLVEAREALQGAIDYLNMSTRYDFKGHKEECIKYIHEAMVQIDKIIAD